MDEETEEAFALLEESLEILDKFSSKIESTERVFETHEIDIITELHSSAVKLNQ